jgi:hypothetical protein
MSMPTIDQVLAAGRNLVSYAMGIATAFGILKVNGIDLSVISTSLDHIFNGIKEISIGLGPLVTIAAGWWAAHRSSKAVQVANVNAMPEVKGVVTTATPEGRALADAIPSPTVAAAGTPAAANVAAKT